MKKLFLLAIFILITFAVAGCGQPADKLIGEKRLERPQDTEKLAPTAPVSLDKYVKRSELEKGMLANVYSCPKICQKDEKCQAGQCVKFELKNKNVCGNYVCEAGEKYDGKAEKGWGKQCYFDCPPPCQSEYCNEKVTVACACDEYDILSNRHGCIKDAQPCSNCGKQEKLFNEVLKMQTQVFDCLSNYFQFQPSRLVYKVFENLGLEKCNLQEGCVGAEGGIGGADYVLFHNLNGFREYDEVTPTKPEHLTADVHESTHYFLYQMLHGLPQWFHEAVAIQTNERLDCSSRQAPWGDSYLSEVDGGQGGINMNDGTVLNVDYYKRLKSGQTALSKKEKDNHYLIGTLFIIGLKEDYQCGLNCVRDIVIKLREKEQENCRAGANCAVYKEMNVLSVGWLGGGEKQANKIIKKTVNEIVKKDTSPLFGLLKIN